MSIFEVRLLLLFDGIRLNGVRRSICRLRFQAQLRALAALLHTLTEGWRTMPPRVRVWKFPTLRRCNFLDVKMKHPKPLILPPLVPAASEQQGSTEFLASSRLHPESALSPALASTTTASDRILLRPEVLEMVGIGRTTLYKMVKAGTFPAPLNLTARIRGWRLSAVLRFLDSVEDK